MTLDRVPHDPDASSRAPGTVAVHEASSEASAQEVATRLFAARVPAAVELARSELAWVVVPWDKQIEAEALLRAWGLSVLPRFGGGFDLAPLQGQSSRPELRLVQGGLREEEPIEPDDGPVELPLPDSGPVMPRVVVALAAIGFGIGAQRAVEALVGVDGAPSAMAASGAGLSELWRLVTAGFYHFSLEHLASNMAFGLLFGVVLFGTHGVGATMLAWLFASIVGIGTEASFSPEHVLVAGASAGNYGLVGLWARGQVDRARRAFLPRHERIKALGVVLVLAPGALTPVTKNGTKIAVLAHAFGFLAGYLAGYLFERRVTPDALPALDRRSRGGQWIALFFVGAAFLAGFRRWTLG